jgi:hypothetical protein
MDNKAFEELNEKSKIFFDKIINLFNKNNTDVYLFINFLLHDIIPIKQMNKNSSLYSKLNQIIKDSDIFLEDYFDTLFYNNSNINNSYLKNQIKLSIVEKIKEIKKKIQECDRDIEKIIKFFVYLKISKKIAVETVPDFIFSKKSILYIKDERESYSLGEVFSRYLFFLIGDKDLSNLEKSKPDNFYNKNIFDFIEADIKDFREWNFLVKYFPIHIYLIELLFHENSNYKVLFSKDTFINSIYDLSKMPSVEKNKKDKKKKKDKRQRGGKKFKKEFKPKDLAEGIDDMLIKKNNKPYEKKEWEKKNNPYEKKYFNEKKNNEKKTKMIEICNKTTVNKLNLKNSLINEFHNIFFDKYIKPKLTAGVNNGVEININRMIKNPFNNSEFMLKDYLLKKSNRERKYTNTEKDLADLNSNFKFDIFQILNTFKTQNNKTLLEDVLEKFKYNIIILLFCLYSIKKKLYTTYINIALNKFNINIEKINSPENKGNQKNITQNKEQSSMKPNNKLNNKSPNKTPDIYKNMNQPIKEKLIKIDKNINTLKHKIKEIESHKMQNYEKKILIVEEYIQKLILKKRDILKST